MHIVLLCATNRGLRFLEKLTKLCSDCDITVMSFPEQAGEPPFFEAIRQYSQFAGHRFFEARNVAAAKLQAFWKTSSVDLLMAVSWRYMVPPAIYKIAKKGAFVFHDSMLPEYRGFSPTVWAIVNGKHHTGVTLFEMGETVDAGPVVDQTRVPIGPDDAIPIVMEKVTRAYLELLERNCKALRTGTAARQEQDHTKATYMRKRLPQDNQIDWSQTSARVYNLIRAVTAPYAGAYTTLDGKILRVWSAHRHQGHKPKAGGAPGQVIEVIPDEGAIVLAGNGPLLITRVQREGESATCAADVLNRVGITLGK